MALARQAFALSEAVPSVAAALISLPRQVVWRKPHLLGRAPPLWYLGTHRLPCCLQAVAHPLIQHGGTLWHR